VKDTVRTPAGVRNKLPWTSSPSARGRKGGRLLKV
jgi:hypothetical protein